MVLRDITSVHMMLDDTRVMTGQKSTSEMQNIWKEQREKQGNAEDIHANKVSLPSSLFDDFPMITYENEKDFEYQLSTIMVQFFEKFNDRALEFPETLDPQARAMIHALCNFIGVHSISVGKKSQRRVIIYPRHLFPKVTEKELERVRKEREKIREKFKEHNFAGIPREKPVTMREKLIREIYFEQRGMVD